MASPLILRIQSKFDNAGTTQATSEFKGLKTVVSDTTGVVKLSQKEFDELKKILASVGKEGKETGNTLDSAFKQFRKSSGEVISIFRTFRRVAAIGAIFGAPIILAVKNIIDLQNAIQPLTTTLNQLGQTSDGQVQKIVAFAKSLQLTSGITVSESLPAIENYIKKTKGSLDATQALNTAETLHLATGRKIADVLTALADAQNGNATSLAELTDKRKEDIFELVQQGKLLPALTEEFKNQADVGAKNLGNQFSIATANLKNFGINIAAVAADTSLLFNLLSGKSVLKTSIEGVLESAKNQATQLKTELAKAFDPLKTFNASTLEDSVRAFQSLKSEAREIGTILATQPNLTNEETEALNRNLTATQLQIQLLKQRIDLERVLPLAQRAVLSAQTQVNQNQLDFLKVESSYIGKNSNEKTRAIREQLIQEETLAKQNQAIAESRQKAQQLRDSQNGQLAIEQEQQLQSDLALKKSQIFEEGIKKNDSLRLKELQDETKTNQAFLEIFKRTEDSKLNLSRNTLKFREEEEKAVNEKILNEQIRILVAQKEEERDTLLSQGNLTNQQEIRLATELQNEIAKIRQTANEQRATKEIGFALLSASEKSALKKRQEEISKIQQEIINRGGVDFLDNSTKTRIKNLKAEKDLVDAQIKATRGNASGDTEGQSFKDSSDKLLKDRANSFASAQTEAFLSAQKEAVKSFGSDIDKQLQALQNQKRVIDVKVKLNPDTSALDPLAQLVANLIISKLKDAANKAGTEQSSQVIVAGAPQAGS